MDQVNFQSWIGRSQIDCGVVSDALAAQIYATVRGESASGNPKDDHLSPLWHWCAFPPVAPMTDLGADGHVSTHEIIPPVGLERRMWAGGALEFHRPLRVGEPLERRSALRSVTEKAGATGPMVFVSVDHAIYGSDGLAIEERQDIVYLDRPDAFCPPKKHAMPDAPDAAASVRMSETLLFRYSAVTFNAHRIHYDLRFARDVEKYPDLVVHGPLQATLLMQMAERFHGRAPRRFEFRGVHPMFCGTRLDLAAVRAEPNSLSLFAGQSGHQGMQATAYWED